MNERLQIIRFVFNSMASVFFVISFSVHFHSILLCRFRLKMYGVAVVVVVTIVVPFFRFITVANSTGVLVCSIWRIALYQLRKGTLWIFDNSFRFARFYSFPFSQHVVLTHHFIWWKSFASFTTIQANNLCTYKCIIESVCLLFFIAKIFVFSPNDLNRIITPTTFLNIRRFMWNIRIGSEYVLFSLFLSLDLNVSIFL